MTDNDDKLVDEINEMFHTLHQKEDEYRAMVGPIPAPDSRADKRQNTYTVTVSGTVLICRDVEANSPEEACEWVKGNWIDADFETVYNDDRYEAEEE
jgi:hypothetical protein